jgi:tetratricopeptide (TPR) repeat protein
MSESLHSDEQIIDYLDGLMGADERDAFESELAKDPGLKERLEDLRVAREAVKQFGTRERVGSLHKEMMKELKQDRSPAKVINMRKAVRITMAVAASLLLIVVGVKFFNASNSPEQLYNDTFVDYSLPVERGAQQNNTTVEKDYASRNYTAVIKDAQSNTLSGKDSFLTAISYLKTGNTTTAIQWLNTVNGGSSFYPDAQFYLSLAYLKNKNYDKALELMNQIHDNRDHPYNSSISSELIEKVKKLK